VLFGFVEPVLNIAIGTSISDYKNDRITPSQSGKLFEHYCDAKAAKRGDRSATRPLRLSSGSAAIINRKAKTPWLDAANKP
jgi:hypothetical protein